MAKELFCVGSTVYSYLHGASEPFLLEAVIVSISEKTGNFRVELVTPPWAGNLATWDPDKGVFSTKREATTEGKVDLARQDPKSKPRAVKAQAKSSSAKRRSKATEVTPTARRRAKSAAA
jgi:hypothetical protein